MGTVRGGRWRPASETRGGQRLPMARSISRMHGDGAAPVGGQSARGPSADLGKSSGMMMKRVRWAGGRMGLVARTEQRKGACEEEGRAVVSHGSDAVTAAQQREGLWALCARGKSNAMDSSDSVSGEMTPVDLGPSAVADDAVLTVAVPAVRTNPVSAHTRRWDGQKGYRCRRSRGTDGKGHVKSQVVPTQQPSRGTNTAQHTHSGGPIADGQHCIAPCTPCHTAAGAAHCTTIASSPPPPPLFPPSYPGTARHDSLSLAKSH